MNWVMIKLCPLRGRATIYIIMMAIHIIYMARFQFLLSAFLAQIPIEEELYISRGKKYIVSIYIYIYIYKRVERSRLESARAS